MVRAFRLLAVAAWVVGLMPQAWAFFPVTRYEVGLFGDVPYTADEEASFVRLLDDTGKAPLAFSLHVGDFKGGGVPCDDPAYRHAKALLDRSRHPVVLVPGDNEWTDCHRKACGGYDPLERLDFLRKTLFGDDWSLGQRKLKLERQSPSFPEHTRWEHGSVTYLGLNVTGSNNNYGRNRAMDAEYHERQAAYMSWMQAGFEWARARNSKGILLFIQANPNFGKPWYERTGFNDFLNELQRLTVSFGKPVVLVHGDTHYFRMDKPMTTSDDGHIVPHFTRVETFGSPNVHWVRMVVDHQDPNLFRFEPVLVPGNLGQPAP